jgi:hypothetical protein
MERFLWIGKNTDIRVFMDRLDILSTYLPLFTPMKGEVLKELSDRQKSTILYDALPVYYIEKMKEANTEPIKMSLEDLFQFALNIEEAAINPEKDSEGNTRNSKEQKTDTPIPQKQGVKVKIIKKDSEGNPQNSKEQKTDTSIPRKQGSKGENHKKSGVKTSILKGQELTSCDFCGRKGHTEKACPVKQKAMASSKRDTKDRSAQWKKHKA